MNNIENQQTLSLAFTPALKLTLYSDRETNEFISNHISEKIHSFFSINDSMGLLRLGLTNFNESLPVSISFWQQFARIFITEVCKHASADEKITNLLIEFPNKEIAQLIDQAPFIRGVEYFNIDTAELLWNNLTSALHSEIAAFDGSLSHFLSSFHSGWNTIGRVCFHLAENKKNEDYPFAFLATYTTGLSKNANTQHVQLGNALVEYADKNKKSHLLSLLLPVHRAAEKSAFLKTMVDSGKIFKPQVLSAQDAHQFLKDIPHFESSGVMKRVPNWWNAQKPPRPTVKVTVGEKNASQVGLNALLDFDIHFAMPSGEALTSAEFLQLLQSTSQLVQIKGQWVEVDNEKLNQVLSHWKTLEKQVKQEGLSFAEGLRLLSGVSHLESKDASPEMVNAWSTVIEGDWLQKTFAQLRNPTKIAEKSHQALLRKHLKAVLRHYQERGVEWLWWLYNMQLGGCLADDMGLGKTIQIISLLLLVKNSFDKKHPHLLILPASLLGNWQSEINRFAPELSIFIAHASGSGNLQPILSEIDVVMTTYGTVNRLPWISENTWDIVICDEAQAIKNPAAKQTRSIKLLKSRVRFALTGTPIENRLLDLWSLFDFVSPGLF